MHLVDTHQLAKLHQNQNDAAREAEILYARQIRRQTGCAWAEALRVAARRIAMERGDT
jgi:hypothetical protein